MTTLFKSGMMLGDIIEGMMSCVKKKKKKKEHPKVAEVIGYNQAQKQVGTDTEISCKIGVVIRIVWLATVFWQWLIDYVDCKAYKK